MTDTEMRKKYNLPSSTIQDWKNREKTNWRYKIYMKLKQEDSQAVTDLKGTVL